MPLNPTNTVELEELLAELRDRIDNVVTVTHTAQVAALLRSHVGRLTAPATIEHDEERTLLSIATIALRRVYDVREERR